MISRRCPLELGPARECLRVLSRCLHCFGSCFPRALVRCEVLLAAYAQPIIEFCTYGASPNVYASDSILWQASCTLSAVTRPAHGVPLVPAFSAYRSCSALLRPVAAVRPPRVHLTVRALHTGPQGDSPWVIVGHCATPCTRVVAGNAYLCLNIQVPALCVYL